MFLSTDRSELALHLEESVGPDSRQVDGAKQSLPKAALGRNLLLSGGHPSTGWEREECSLSVEASQSLSQVP